MVSSFPTILVRCMAPAGAGSAADHQNAGLERAEKKPTRRSAAPMSGHEDRQIMRPALRATSCCAVSLTIQSITAGERDAD